MRPALCATKNVSVICLKNIGLYSVAGLTYYFVGYNLMYVDVGSWVGSLTFLYGPSADELALLAGQTDATAAVVKNGYATMSDWFFQMVFVATACLGCFRRSGRTGEAVVVPGLYDHFDSHHLSYRRCLDVG